MKVVNISLPPSLLITNIMKKAFLPAHQAPSFQSIKKNSQASTSKTNVKQYQIWNHSAEVISDIILYNLSLQYNDLNQLSSTLTAHWNYLRSFEKFDCPVPNLRNINLIGLECSMRILKVLQVILMCI